MDLAQLQLVEKLCAELYQSSNIERQKAEAQLQEFTTNIKFVQHSRFILDNSSSPFARMFASYRFFFFSSLSLTN